MIWRLLDTNELFEEIVTNNKKYDLKSTRRTVYKFFFSFWCPFNRSVVSRYSCFRKKRMIDISTS